MAPSRPWAQTLINAQVMDGPDEKDDEPDKAPETPLDEPRPPRIQDPPPQPAPKGPYVV